MQRVKTATAVTSKPAYSESGTPGYFTKGDAVAAIPATVPGQDWYNMVQEELRNLIVAAGLTPSATDDTQLAQAIAALIAAHNVAETAHEDIRALIEGIVIPVATVAAAGISRRATVAEALAGLAAEPHITPAGLKAALDAVLTAHQTAALPIGSIIAVGSETVPDDYLECDGSALSRTVYSDLFAGATTTPTATMDFAAAEHEDVRGAIATLTVDTANTSGHFNSAKAAKVLPGCRMRISGADYTITSSTGDGTAADSVVFSGGTLSTGAHTITGIYGTQSTGDGATLSGYSVSTPSFAADLIASGTAFGSYSFRNILRAADLSTSGDRLRVQLKAHASGALIIDRASIVPRETGANGTTVPTPITFSGSSSCSIPAGTTYWSDWIDFSMLETSDYILILDLYDNCPYVARADSGYEAYIKANANSWDQQTVTGYTSEVRMYCVQAVEVQSMRVPTSTPYAVLLPELASSAWAAVDYMTIGEALHGQSAWYAVKLGGVWQVRTGAAWLPVARDNAGSWEYWSGSAWLASTVQSEAGAVAQAMTVAGNRMTGATLNALTAAQWAASGGYAEGSEVFRLAVVLQSAVNTTTPSVSSAKVYDVSALPAPPSVPIGTRFGVGDGSTTFNLPDLRSRTLAGWAHGATRDPDVASRTAMAGGGASGDHVGSVRQVLGEIASENYAGTMSDAYVLWCIKYQ